MLFLQEDKRNGSAVGKSDLFQDGSGFSPSPEQGVWVKNPDKLLLLLLLMSSDTLEPAGTLCCIGEALQER